MSSAEQVIALKALLNELETAISGLNATKYLSAAGLVILLYDHLLLFGEEKRLIWAARPSWSKTLFLVNRYVVPLCLIVTTHILSGLSAAGLSTSFCRTWLSMASFLCVSTLAVANIFVVHRIYALWGRNQRILRLLVSTFTMVYIAAIISLGFSLADLIPHLSYSPIVKTCAIDRRPKLYVIPYALPIAFDVFLFLLTCWNAFDRPRSMQTAIVKQLYLDGVVYFAALLSLRIFNIMVLAFANLAYIQLGVYFLWAMITVLINRMLITISSTVGHPQPLAGSSGRESPFDHLAVVDPPFELEFTELESVDQDDAADFMDFSHDRKEIPPSLPQIEHGQAFQMRV